MEVPQMKAALRKAVQGRIRSLTVAEIERRSSAIQKRVLNLKEYQDAKSVGIYLSMPNGEVSTNEIVVDALNRGKSVFVPFLHPNPGISHADDKGIHTPKRVMNMVSLHSLQDYQDLARDKWGIPTPDAASISQRRHILGSLVDGATQRRHLNGPLDLVVVPGVAFDRACNRLGHGRGFYDFFLTEYGTAKQGESTTENTSRPLPLLVALSLPEQLLPVGEIPTECHDRLVDTVITDSEVVERTRGAA